MSDLLEFINSEVGGKAGAQRKANSRRSKVRHPASHDCIETKIFLMVALPPKVRRIFLASSNVIQAFVSSDQKQRSSWWS